MKTRRVLLFAVPLGVAAAAGGGFWVMLQRMRSGSFNPRGVPSVLDNKRVPGFNLPGLIGPGFSGPDLYDRHRPVLINFWASWCPPCREEHPVLMALKQDGVPIWGIAYKDAKKASLAYLDTYGNPFERVAADAGGRVAIDWGLTGVPETFLVDGDGYVRWHMVGPLTHAMIPTVKSLMELYAG